MSAFGGTDELRAMVAKAFPQEVSTNVEVDGLTTEILYSSFTDHIFIVVTQINKFGTLLKATSDVKADGNKIYDVATLLGRRDDPLLSIYARQLIERLGPLTAKPVLLSISLHENGRGKEHFEKIINRILEIAF